ncbi:MAG: phosphoribosylformylglycinamidine synthase I [Candidatus Omnitrophica bacterium]|nr:phosphoribosylformylglycinamidine synthase I [Candidatus Omnitrophota bacterium]
MKRPRVCVLRTGGTNCDRETAFAFEQAGADTQAVHVNRLINRPDNIHDFHILALPGGFTYGDDVAAGKILANEIRYHLRDDIRRFIDDGKLVIGICNGFQVLVKAGLLPGNSGTKGHPALSERRVRTPVQHPVQSEERVRVSTQHPALPERRVRVSTQPPARQEVSLIINDSGKFEDRWVYLKSEPFSTRGVENGSRCVWTEGLPEVIYLPVAHGEGKFVVGDAGTLSRLREDRQVVFRYSDARGKRTDYPGNPNGSVDDIAGICDTTGRILGLMPHPERHAGSVQHPRWTGERETRPAGVSPDAAGDGLRIFQNGVRYAQELM